jgi:C_GCAxxG_C_C family probable redox protein
MTKSIEEKAIESFRSGLNCAQSVVTAYCDELKMDYDLALNISCGFGGGMGRMQETCGALTGSFMVLGAYNCGKFTDNTKRKESTYTMVQELNEKFKMIHGSTKCKSLLNCEIKTEEGHRLAKEKNLFGTICEKCITDSISIIGELTGK